jgi:hypothetical protein
VTTRFLVELYLPTPDLDAAAAAACAAVEPFVRIVQAISIPVDETCFLVVEADDEEAVAELTKLAGLSVNRISVVAPNS